MRQYQNWRRLSAPRSPMPAALPAKKVTELPLPFASTYGGRRELCGEMPLAGQIIRLPDLFTKSAQPSMDVGYSAYRQINRLGAARRARKCNTGRMAC